ncbi:MAG: hypothetical protein JO316_25820 [Abitibacteriaceae bacterium]|nr:hypothetical protein [Abditibacteriaceae bacterium]
MKIFNRITSCTRISTLGLAASCLWLSSQVQAADTPNEPAAANTVEALVYSSMPSTAAHRPEMALDGDTATYFKSVYGMSGGDNFLILLSRPIPVQSLHIVTGDADNQDLLTDGFVETSPDAKNYSRAAAFNEAGVADATLNNQMVSALRIRLNPRRGIPSLLVREITINSPVKIAHVMQGPGRGFYDVSASPDLEGWAQKAERQMEEFWPDTAALLYSDGFITPNMVTVVYRTGPGVTGVAATGGGVMTVNTQWCHQHPEDTGLTVHETAHVIQAMSAYNPVWLIEGIADYIRWVKFEPENQHQRINTAKATYHDSYRTTATFLGWCELHYDSRLVTKLNHDVRFGHYNNDLFKKYCGKDVDTLWTEFIAAYKADPVNIITPPVAAADRPRQLPTVKAGSSVPINLSAAFNGMGFSNDGATFNETSGFDAGGAAYSAKLLGTTVNWKDVQFTIGPANAPNIISATGQVLPLTAGNYASLWLLGAAVEGNQMAQTLTVTYTDGTTENLVQNFSDWFEPQSFPGESRAVKMAYRNMANGAKDPRTFHAYSYGFNLNPAKTVKSLTLPNNPNVKILAITLAKP